jgi:Transposase, Mutator family
MIADPVAAARCTSARRMLALPGRPRVGQHRGSRRPVVAPVVAAQDGKLPAAAGYLSGARDDLLAFSCVPREIWRQGLVAQPRGYVNRGLRRPVFLVGIFPAATPSSAPSASSWPNRMTDGPNHVAAWEPEILAACHQPGPQ